MGTENVQIIGKKKGCDRLVQCILHNIEKVSMEMEENELDEMINDIAAVLGTTEANGAASEKEADIAIESWLRVASGINNEGIERQVRAILHFHGIRGGICELNDFLGVHGFQVDFPILEPAELSRGDLEHVVALIRDVLYYSHEEGGLQWDLEWDEESIERVAGVLNRFALTGVGGEKKEVVEV